MRTTNLISSPTPIKETIVYIISIGLMLIFAFLAISFPVDKQQEVISSAPRIATILLFISVSVLIGFHASRCKLGIDRNG